MWLLDEVEVWVEVGTDVVVNVRVWVCVALEVWVKVPDVLGVGVAVLAGGGFGDEGDDFLAQAVARKAVEMANSATRRMARFMRHLG